MKQFDEPPELHDSSGERIVVFRNSDGSLFSNHPEFNFAMAMHKQAESKAAEAEAMAVDTGLDDDVPEAPDNNDGTLAYEEMDSKQLLELTKQRGLTLPDRKRSSAIAALEEYDAQQQEKQEA